MQLITNQTDLLQCFREIDRDAVDVSALTFPLAVEPVTTWALGSRAFILFRDGAQVKGFVCHRDNSSIPAVATMCQWCHRVRSHGAVKMLSVRSGEKRWSGQYLCSDLDCLHGEPSVDDLRESLSSEERTKRTLERIRTFAARCVF